MNDHEVNQIARMCHEVNRAYCETQGDFTQKPWEEAPDWQRGSVLNGVRYHLQHPDSSPEQSHENWMAEKEKDGWIWGPKKDAEKKTHPDLLPYFQLDPAERAKNFMFIAVVRAMTETKRRPTFPRYERGTMVIANRDLDPMGAKVKKGAQGVVFEEAEFHEPHTGPMVRWFDGGMCNVYDGQTRITCY